MNHNPTAFAACPYQTKLNRFTEVNMLDINFINLEKSWFMITKTDLQNFLTINQYLIIRENSRNATRLLAEYYEMNN
jgi:hypothetical protein